MAYALHLLELSSNESSLENFSRPRKSNQSVDSLFFYEDASDASFVTTEQPTRVELIGAKPALPEFAYTATSDQFIKEAAPTNTLLEKRLPLGKCLKAGSAIVAILCIESIALWLTDYPGGAIFSPFPAMLFLVASPFFYGMGVIARKPKIK